MRARVLGDHASAHIPDQLHSCLRQSSGSEAGTMPRESGGSGLWLSARASATIMMLGGPPILLLGPFKHGKYHPF